MKNGLIFILFVLLVVAWAGANRQPRAAIEDTTKSEIIPAAAPDPKPKPPVAWHLDPVCLIAPIEPQGEHQV